MKNKRKCLVYFSTLLVTFFSFLPRISACSCAILSVEEAYQNADLVVKARVISEHSVASKVGEGTMKQRYFVLEIKSAYKGKTKKERVKIYTGMGGGDCGSNFKEGADYLIFGKKCSSPICGEVNDEDKFRTTICSGNRPVGRKGLTIFKREMVQNALSKKEFRKRKKELAKHYKEDMVKNCRSLKRIKEISKANMETD